MIVHRTPPKKTPPRKTDLIKREFSAPAMIAAVMAVVAVVFGLGWYMINRQPTPVNDRPAAQAGKETIVRPINGEPGHGAGMMRKPRLEQDGN
jgi:hypothetical protein